MLPFIPIQTFIIFLLQLLKIFSNSSNSYPNYNILGQKFVNTTIECRLKIQNFDRMPAFLCADMILLGIIPKKTPNFRGRGLWQIQGLGILWRSRETKFWGWGEDFSSYKQRYWLILHVQSEDDQHLYSKIRSCFSWIKLCPTFHEKSLWTGFTFFIQIDGGLRATY